MAVCYAKDAMSGLRLMNHLSDPATRDIVIREHTFADGASAAGVTAVATPGCRRRSARRRFAWTSRFRALLIWIAKFAMFPISPTCGATSTR